MSDTKPDDQQPTIAERTSDKPEPTAKFREYRLVAFCRTVSTEPHRPQEVKEEAKKLVSEWESCRTLIDRMESFKAKNP